VKRGLYRRGANIRLKKRSSVRHDGDTAVFFVKVESCGLAGCGQKIAGRHKNYAKHDTHLIAGKSEENINDICSKIPSKSLALCFVDPFDCDFNIDNLKTISKCAFGVDFLCLLALQMDAKRNIEHYMKPDSKIDRMIGNTTWRTRWNNKSNVHEDFAKFLATEFAHSMSDAGYLETPLHQMREVTTHDTNVPLYYIAMFSKNQKAFDLWKEVLVYSSPQRGLFD